MKLVSKIQLSTYEKGEFSAEQPRSLAETLALIEALPWQDERKQLHTQDDIKPGVVLAGLNGDFLKLTTFYNNKFQLLYLNLSGKEFGKTIRFIPDATPFIEAFFNGLVEATDFKPQRNLLSRRSNYLTRDFLYAPTKRQLIWFALTRTDLWIFALMLWMFAIIWIIHLLSVPSPPLMSILIPAVIGFLPIITIGIYILIFVFNHSKYTKGYSIQISKGDRRFLYGLKGAMRPYHKADIREIIIKGSTNARSPIYNGIRFAKLTFRNGEVIIIPKMLIGNGSLSEKFAECPVRNVSKSPYIRKRDFKPAI
jgi:hypothetical protein